MRLSVTKTGRTYLVLTLGVGLGALNTGNNLLYLVLGVLLSMIIVSGVLSERALRRLRVRRLGTEAAYAGEPFAFRWAVECEAGAAFALTLAEDHEELQGHGTLAYAGAGQEQVVRGDLQAPRRGPFQLTGIKVTTVFPFGLFAKTRLIPSSGVLVVYPRRGFACADPPERDMGPAGEAGNPRRSDGNGDLLGLRELADGEDARRIHWKKSAAAGKLLRVEREREERRSHVLHVEPGLTGDGLERRCEEVAAQAQRLFGRGDEVGLETGSTRLRPGAGPGQHRRLLRALAYLGYGEEEA